MTRMRVIIENVSPCVDNGRFRAKRVIGEPVIVEADAFTDGHDVVACTLQFRQPDSPDWHSTGMAPVGNDRWRGEFTPVALGDCTFTVTAWVDHIDTWRLALRKKHDAGQNVDVDLLRGAELVTELAGRAAAGDALELKQLARSLADSKRDLGEKIALAEHEALRGLSRRYPNPEFVTRHDPVLEIQVERQRARFSTWYEMFPRSTSGKNGVHGTFADCEAHLPYIAGMGFDVLYLPPIHPIGKKARKGPNNNPRASAGDPGSPWAIGGAAGGHKSVHPDLGTLADFLRLVERAAEHNIEIALDIAFQCSPDHPYVREHPEWFLMRPDGSVQYAENPPKKYEDIVAFHFETEAWQSLWSELHSVVEFWIGQGVKIFRVDNPHTKSFAMWEWLITEVMKKSPDVIFLAEAFTRPKVMYRLAKLGFTQSYNYFPWRNGKHELTSYFTELAQPPVSDFLHANLWPNTPDILTEYLQFGGRPAFMVRATLAATLGASYGIYGPAFELTENTPREPGSEEYLDSEKYQLRHWDLQRSESLRDFIGRLNQIRREHTPLQSDSGLRFHAVDNDALIAYSKTTAATGESVLTVVNLDPHHAQSGWLSLDLASLGLPPDQPFQAHDLLSSARFLWEGPHNYVALDPQRTPCHIFRIRRRVRSERDFDYFL
ncbi:MAG: alpha-1,4-glucan--maltose-1-phosphate maltosyltransferase [Chromatiales bacterium]|jgi:starch synthase (maltosyl-transferring)|nr:MAG: alpha-1,4-glucan--maltose-1-phosphate maltosyltransferase [Chromatiales bacterium]